MRSAVGLVLLSACTSNIDGSIVLPEVPADIDVVAVWLEDAEGRTLGNPVLQARAERYPFDEDPNAVAARLVGYRGTDLNSTSIRAALPADPLLAAPHFVATSPFVDGTAHLEPVSTNFEVTSSTLPPCPQLLARPTPLVEIECALQFCDAVAEQRGCTIVVDAIGCSAGVFEGVVDGRGTVTWSDAGIFGACRHEPTRPNRTVSANCESEELGVCRFDLYAAAVDLVSETRTVQVIAPTESLPPDPSRAGPLDGFISSMLVFSDHVWAVTYGGRERANCTGGSSRAVRIDSSAVQVDGGVDLPPCVDVAIYDERTDRIFAGVGNQDLQLVAYDREFVQQLTVPIPIPEPGTFRVVDVRALDSGHVAVAIRGDAAYVVVFRANDLSYVGTSMDVVVDSTILIDLPGADLAIVAHRTGEVRPMTVDPVRALVVQSTRAICRNTRFVGGVALDPVSGRLAFTFRHPYPSLRLIPPSFDDCSVAPYYEADAIVTAFTSTMDGGGFVVGAMSADRVASFAAMDVVNGHFLPGAVEIGRGIVGSIQRDDSNRYWAMLPWSGHVVRIDPGSDLP